MTSSPALGRKHRLTHPWKFLCGYSGAALTTCCNFILDFFFFNHNSRGTGLTLQLTTSETNETYTQHIQYSSLRLAFLDQNRLVH